MSSRYDSWRRRIGREKDDPRNFVESFLPLSLILFSRSFDSYLDGILKKLGSLYSRTDSSTVTFYVPNLGRFNPRTKNSIIFSTFIFIFDQGECYRISLFLRDAVRSLCIFS